MCRFEGCEKKFWGEAGREEHEKSVHRGQRLKCDHCEKSYSFSAKTSLMRHMLIKHDILVKCAKCAESFDDFNTYLTHRRQKCNKMDYGEKSVMRNAVRLGEPHPKFKSRLKFCCQILVV